MDSSDSNLPPPDAARNPIAALRRFTRPRPPEERCELCAAVLPPEHEHLVEPQKRQLLCACGACAILFSGKEATRYRRIPRRVECWPNFRMSDDQWAALGIPISLAFIFRGSAAKEIFAVYPSPAGPTETLLPQEAWEALAAENPGMNRLEPDVEALLINRVGPERCYFRVPIDQCYQLVGIIRMHWRSLSGGTEVWKHIATFFDGLTARSVKERSHA